MTRVLRVPCARAHQFSAYDIKYEKRGSFCDIIFRLSNTQNKKLGFRYKCLFVILIVCCKINSNLYVSDLHQIFLKFDRFTNGIYDLRLTRFKNPVNSLRFWKH